jgi:septal ring factor EnvC (AmiA/AmiB activator)
VPRPEAAALLLGLALATADMSRGEEPTPESKLDTVQHDIDQGRRESEALTKQADALKAELAKLQAQSVQAAAAAQANELRVTAEERMLQQLQQDEAEQKSRLARRRADEAAVLAALERLAAVPPTAMAFQPGSPIDLARGGMLMSAAVPRFEAEARDLAEALGQLSRMEAQIAGTRAELADRQHGLEAARQNIAVLVRRRQSLAGETSQKAEAAARRVAGLVAQASDLRQAIDRVERDNAEHKKAEADQASIARPAAPAGPGPSLALPVAGEVARQFGAAEDYGTSKGIDFSTRAGAQVVAPCAGEIMFAGPFKGYGQILIIDHGGGYHLLMAGIGRIDGSVGQKLVAGEPVGAMAADGTPTLYLELRRDGQPVDPLPYLATHDGKASG